MLSVVFMEQDSHNQLHGEFLNDFRPTDVITFPADPVEDHAGEICVSVIWQKLNQVQERFLLRRN